MERLVQIQDILNKELKERLKQLDFNETSREMAEKDCGKIPTFNPNKVLGSISSRGQRKLFY